jgi:hypothetical protein
LDRNDFVCHYYEYLKQFDIEHSLSVKKLMPDVELLSIREGELCGEVHLFICALLGHLEELMGEIGVVMPVGFRFCLNYIELNERVRTIVEKIENKNK